VIEFDNYITDDTVREAKAVLEHPETVQAVIEKNYQLGKRYYSYGVLERSLKWLIVDLFGVDPLT
jgi:hypothetical protein